MENGPFRATSRSAGNHPEADRQLLEDDLMIVDDRPKTAPRRTSHSSSRHEPPTNNKLKLIVAAMVAVVVLALAAAGWMWFSNRANADMAIDSGKYQAVFLTNGQVYFGKLHAGNDEYVKLTNVFYLQTKEEEQADANDLKKSQDDTAASSQTLIKLGSEIHGPSDEMVISKDHVLFFENLKSDGKVSSTIESYNKSNK